MGLAAKWMLYLDALRGRYCLAKDDPREGVYLADQYRRAQGALRRFVDDEAAKGIVIPARVEEALKMSIEESSLSGRAA